MVKLFYFYLLKPSKSEKRFQSPWSSQNRNSNRFGFKPDWASTRVIFSAPHSSSFRLSLSLSVLSEMVRLFLTLPPAISRLSIYPGISILATNPSLRLQKHHKLKTETTTFSLISPSSSSNYQRTRFYSTGTRIASLPKSQNSNFDDNLVVLGIETSCDDTAAAVVSLFNQILVFSSTYISPLLLSDIGICGF